MDVRFWIVFFAGCFSSCIPARQYEDLQKQTSSIKAENREVRNRNSTLEVEIDTLQQRMTLLQKKYDNLIVDAEIEKERHEKLEAVNKEVLGQYENLLNKNQDLINSSAANNSNLNDQIANQTSELLRKEQRLLELEKRLENREKDLKYREEQLQVRINALEGDVQLKDRKVQELERLLEEKNSKTKDLTKKIKKALLSYSSSDLAVEEKNGRIYVSLSQKLLFSSGSKVLNAEGKAAIAQIAQILQQEKGVEITIEGHTDADGDADSNWDLSVLRATSVLKELHINGVPEHRMLASGRGETRPIASNATTSGKAKNRRTEIILSPKLDEVYQLLEK